MYFCINQNEKTMKKIYISGPITGNTNAEANFQSAEAFLRAKGFDPINPMKLSHDHSQKWEDFMKEDIKSLMDADAIYMLRSSDKSEGAQLELFIAVKLKMPVFHEEYPWCLDKVTPATPESIIEVFDEVPQY